MQTLAKTIHVAFGCPPERFDVTFSVGDERQVTVRGRGRSRRLQWQGTARYKPGSREHLQKAIATFLGILEHEATTSGPEIEEANEQLIVAGSVPYRKLVDVHERQLPVSDRA